MGLDFVNIDQCTSDVCQESSKKVTKYAYFIYISAKDHFSSLVLTQQIHLESITRTTLALWSSLSKYIWSV